MNADTNQLMKIFIMTYRANVPYTPTITEMWLKLPFTVMNIT